MGWGWGQPLGLRESRTKLPPSVPTLQVDELERKVKSQQEQLFLTKTELTNTMAELKMRAIQAEGQHTQACCWGLGTWGPLRSPTHTPPLCFQNAWSWRRTGPGRAWRTRNICASRRCLISCVVWALPSPRPRGLQTSQWGTVLPRQTPGRASLNNLGLLMTVPADVRPKPSPPVSRRDPD